MTELVTSHVVALDLLMEVVRKTQGDQGVNRIMEEGKQQYNQLVDVWSFFRITLALILLLVCIIFILTL
jgi:ABC-type transport system involved in Fe-S cluster assembly fused permease/ATPase subunit